MFYLISLSISARTIHFPFLLPFSRSISFFSCISTIRLFIVLSESPKKLCHSRLCYSRIIADNIDYCKFLQSAVQSVIPALWTIDCGTLKINMQISVLQLMVCSEQKIFKKLFKELCCSVYSIFQIVVICPDKSVAEIPWIFRKNIIAYIESEGLQIFYDKNGCCSCVALTKGVYLPYTRSEFRNMPYWFRCGKSRIWKIFFLAEIVIKGFLYTVGRCIIILIFKLKVYKKSSENS